MEEPFPMVSSTTGVMNSVLNKLRNLVVNRPELAKTVRGLQSLKDAMDNFAPWRVRDALIKEWMEQVREAVNDMEDSVDIWLLSQRQPSDPETDDFAEQIEEFEFQIQDARDRCTRYGLLNKEPTCVALACLPDSAGLGESSHDHKLFYEEEPCFVATEEPRRKLAEQLMEDTPQRQVVSLVGTRGIGKTVLAKEVYRQLRGQFDCGAFLNLGFNPSVKETLVDMVHQLIPQHPAYSILFGDEQDIISKLWSFLISKRYFIVLDDMQSMWTWNVISCILPNNHFGSRILTTTHSKVVAESCCIRPYDVIHKMDALSMNDSKRLFGNTVSVSEKHLLLEDSDDMLKICGGIPLAIILTAGLLSSTYADSGILKKLEQSIIHSSPGQYCISEGTRRILDISYADLPLPLKSCFLYLSAFPKDYTIKKTCLIRRWIAEGFIPQRDQRNLYETGESYFNKLICRRLIQPVFDYHDDEPMGCTVNGVISDFIKSLANEENFVTANADLGSVSFPCERIRRYSLDYRYQDEVDTLTLRTRQLLRVRSLTVFGDAGGMPDFSAFKLIRVLDLEGTEQLKYYQLKSIGSLALLRYLGLRGTVCTSTEVPEDIMALEYLMTLDLRRNRVRHLPEFRTSKLVSLLIDGVGLQRGMGEMQELEELSTILVSSVNSSATLDAAAEFVTKSKQLRKLSIKFIRDGCSSESYRLKVINLLDEVRKSNLHSLFLDGYHSDLLDLLLDCWANTRPRLLRKFELRIYGYIGQVVEKLACLVELTHLLIGLDGEKAGPQVLRGLANLPNLVVLKVNSTNTNNRRGRFIIHKDEFRRLKVFWFMCSDGGMALKFEPGAMPHLRRLRLYLNARKTRELYGSTEFDFGVQHLCSLVEVRATIDCLHARHSEVDSAEAALRADVAEIPGRPKLELSRENEDWMLNFLFRAKVSDVDDAKNDIRQVEVAQIPNKSVLKKSTEDNDQMIKDDGQHSNN